MVVTRKSQISGVVHSIELDVTQEQLDDYAKGKRLLQDVFPNLLPSDREFIKSGITSEEWDFMFGTIED